MGAGFDTLVEVLFRTNPPADVLDDTQDARPVLIGEFRPAPLGVKRRSIRSYVKHPRVECGAGSKYPYVFLEYVLAARVDECRWEQSDEFCAAVAVHRAGGRIGLNHTASFQIADDQPIVAGIEDASILTFFFFGRRAVPAFVHEGFLLLRPMA